MIGFNLRSQLLDGIYDFLNVGQTPQKADCIFVYAGRPERKIYALDLLRLGYAKRIIFSVGRFEWRGFPRLGLEQDGGLSALAPNTPPSKRHFFVCMDGKQTQCFLIKTRTLGTLSETLELAKYIREESIKSIIIVSTAFHLRRATATLKRFFPNLSLKIFPVAVPEMLASDKQTEWWSDDKMVSLILQEYLKYISYKFFLSLFFSY